MPSFDWMHAAALALGALATVLFPKKAAAGKPADPAATNSATSQHPLFDTLIQVLESKLTDLIHVEPGDDGTPVFTLRVVLVQDEAKKAV